MNPVSDIPGLSALRQEAAGGDPEIRIAIIDGPVDLGHPSLAGARLTFGGSTQGATASSVRSEHGTHVASVLMAQPGGPVLGIAPNATGRLYSIYQEGEDGELLPSSQADLALAINRAVGDGAHLINISSGQITPTGQAERILADAVRRCAERGTLIVAAAGNDGCRCLQVPAALDTVLAVGACDLDGQPLAFSNYGGSYAINGILAPGQGIAGASPRAKAGVALRSGTSFATPVVTGVAALFLSRLHQSGQDVDPQAVRSALLAGASPCTADEQAPGGRCLAGRLDVAGAGASLVATRLDRDAPQVAGLSASGTARAPAGLERFEQRGSGQSTPPQIIRESTMSDTSNGGAVHTSQILGPDGNPLRAAVAPAAVGPSIGPEASAEPSVQATALAAAPAAAALPLETGSVQAQSASLGAPQVTGGAMAVETPAAGAMTPGLLPAQELTMASPAPPSPPQGPVAPEVQPSDAGCGCPAMLPAQAQEIGEQVFVIGKLYYDFSTEARLDYFIQTIASWRDGLGDRGDASFGPDRNKSGDQAAPYNPEIMVRYLLNLPPGDDESPGGDTNFPDANAIIWTETIDATPIYAIDPGSAFAWAIYATLVNTLWLQEVAPTLPRDTKGYVSSASAEGAPEAGAFPPKGSVTRVSQAGSIVGSTRLINGTVVPTLQPVWRGLFSWNLYDLLGREPDEWPAGVQGFLERIYNEFRNVGISPQDRALNYSAMNAYNTKRIFAGMAKDQMRLDTVAVDRSTICRPDSDCWDVTYRFFDPTQVLTTARKVWQYTIDVSDVVPVPVGVLRTWEVY